MMKMTLEFDPTDRHTIGPHHYRFVSFDNHLGYEFARVDLPSLTQFFTDADFARFEKDPGYRHDKGWYAPGASKTRAISGAVILSQLPDEEQKIVLHRLSWVERFFREEGAGKVTRSDKSIDGFIDKIYLEAAKMRGSNGRKKHHGKKDNDTIITARTFRRWLSRFEIAKYDALALRTRRDLCGNRTDRLSLDVRKLMDVAVASYMTEKGPTRRFCYDKVLKPAIEELNDTRAGMKLPARALPAFSTFNNAINSRADFAIMAGRKGLKFASEKMAIVSQGVDVHRPCQRWEMDSWTVDLMTLMGVDDQEVDERDMPRAARMNLCVCIDVATRCIMGMRLSRLPGVANAMRTLEMSVSRNKSRFADLSANETPWDMCGVPQTLATDTGPEFLAGLTVAAIDLGANSYLPPAGMAAQRAHIERFFRTVADRAMADFTGRTFGNTQLLGDYPAEKQASLDTDGLAAVLTRWVADIYHNEPHDGLYGETPRNAWMRLTALFPVVPPPDMHKRRAIFGLKSDRRLSAKGIRIANNFYQSLEIQKLRRQDIDVKVTVAIDVQDIGRISVWDGEGWHTVDCTREGMDGVSMEDWLATLADLRRRHAAQTVLSADVVTKAVREIQAIAASSERRASIKTKTPTLAEIENCERELSIGYSMPLPSEPAPETSVVGTLRQRATPAVREKTDDDRAQPEDPYFTIED